MKRPEMLNQKRTDTFSSACVLLAFLFFLCLFALMLVFNRDFFVVTVRGSSMLNTLSDGDFLYADLNRMPERGDIVIVDVTGYPEYSGTAANEDGRKLIIKRLIALEGDTVKSEKWVVSLCRAGEKDFTPLDEPYKYIDPAAVSDYARHDFSAVTVGEGEVFVLGDHRNNSLDSRAAGCFKLSDVKGVVPEWVVEHRGFVAGVEHARTFLFEKS